MLTIIVLAAPLTLGIGGAYFVPSKLTTRSVFMLSMASMATGIFLFYFAAFCAGQLEKVQIEERLRSSKSITSATFAHFQYGWIFFWEDISMMGVFVAIVGGGACLGCGLRMIMSRIGV